VQVKTKNAIVSGLVVLFVGLLWFQFVYSPMESKASKAKAATKDANITADNLRKALDGTSGSKKSTKNNDPSTDAMVEALPVDGGEAAFLRSLDQIQASSGAQWQSITPVAPIVSGSVATITVGITVNGTEDELARYQTGLEALKRTFIMDNVTIGQSGSGTDATGVAGRVFLGPNLVMQISGRIFSQPTAVQSPTGVANGATTPVTGAPAPTGGASSPPGVSNN